MKPVVESNKLERGEVWGEDDPSVRWAGAFAVYGGHGTTQSSTIVYEIEPGHRLGWHTDATEETQYIIAGSGKLFLEDGSTYKVGPGSVFVLPTGVKHDLANAGKAVENGLSRDDAIRALTIWPAEILGVGSQLGSIEVGKIANLTVTRGDLFARDRRIAHVFIDGKPVDLRPPTAPTDRGPNASGTWSLTVNLTGSGGERQETTATMTLQQEGERVTGSLQGQLGSGNITTGSVTGSDVNFTVPITLPPPASQTTDAIFTGTITGNQMRGTVQVVGRGSGTFTATRAGRPEPAASPSPTP